MCDDEVPDLGRGEARASWGELGRLSAGGVTGRWAWCGLTLHDGARLGWGVVGWGVAVRGGAGRGGSRGVMTWRLE